MSQPNTDPSVQNGLPYKWDSGKPLNYAPYINNGLGSSQSSRDSSPIPKLSNVPLSQLPPTRGPIPSSQLPPSRPSMSPIIGPQSNFKPVNYTPNSSPIVNTSTPIARRTDGNINSQVPVSESRASPIQNGSQTIHRQNLIQGNLLTKDLDGPTLSFVPVSAQTNVESDKNIVKQQDISPPNQKNIPPNNNETETTQKFGSTTGLFQSAPKTDTKTPDSNLNDNRIPTQQDFMTNTNMAQQNNPENTQKPLINPPVNQIGPIRPIRPQTNQQIPPNQQKPLFGPQNMFGAPQNQILPNQNVPKPMTNQNMFPTNQNTGFQQYTPPTNQMAAKPQTAGPPTNQNAGFQPYTSQANQMPVKPPTTNQNVAQTVGFQQYSNQMVTKPPLGSQTGPGTNQNTAFQQYTAPTNQMTSKPPTGTLPNQNVGFQQYVAPTNQMAAKPSQPTNPNTGFQQYTAPTNQIKPTPNQQTEQSNQNVGFQQYTTPANQKPIIGPPPNQNAGNQQYTSQANQMTVKPPIGGPPTNQNAGMQQYTSQANPMTVKPPIVGPSTNQNAGYQQYTSPTNQTAVRPTIPNQNRYPPPLTNQQAPPLPNQTQNQPSQSVFNQNLPPNSMYNQQKQENVASLQSTPSTIHGKRYPQSNYQQSTTYSTQQRQNAPNQMYQQSYGQNYQSLNQGMQNMNVGPTGFNRIYGTENIDLLQTPNILPQDRIEPPKICLGQECLNNANCSPEIFRCTMTKIPETNSLLQKSRLPLGVLIHPFKDLNHLPVIQCSSIVRCRACRTYINPFVYFVDTKRWKCNLCYRVNELPEEFQYDPVSKSYGDPSRRPEIKASTIEYIAPSEYMLRPPQPAVYLFLLDVSRSAIECGYLHTICDVLTSQLTSLPGDSRTMVGFIAYNSCLHFYSLGEGLSQPHEMTVLDIEDVFLPCPDNLLVNLKERVELVNDLLALLPRRFAGSYDNGSALGAAIQAAFKMMSATGGRITIFQSSLPSIGPGSLTSREDPNNRSGKDSPHLNPATDFYKRLALECSGHQVAVDLFVLNSQYVDIATLSGISRFSGGCVYHFPLFKAGRISSVDQLERAFRRYLNRKIGFEAVMRIRCTRGLAVHTFHGNFFVRSTDLLSLPNINPDAGFGMQVSIEESLSDVQSVCFQAALLYTSSKGERRIRVHTLCLPVANTLTDILNSADQQCIVGILSKMAVDRSLQSSLSDARDAFINVAIDVLQSYKHSLNMGESVSGLLASHNLKLLPLYILAMLKHTAFRSGLSTRLDDRVFAMCEMKSLPLCHLIQQVYPDLYPVHNLTDEGGYVDNDGIVIPQPPRLQLTSRNIDAFGVYLLDCGQQMIIFVCQKVSPMFLTHVLGVPSFNAISDQFHELPKLENPENQRLHTFIASLNDEKPYCASLHIIRENSPNRNIFLEKLIEDRMETALSYNEFLQHIKTQVK